MLVKKIVFVYNAANFIDGAAHSVLPEDFTVFTPGPPEWVEN